MIFDTAQQGFISTKNFTNPIKYKGGASNESPLMANCSNYESYNR